MIKCKSFRPNTLESRKAQKGLVTSWLQLCTREEIDESGEGRCFVKGFDLGVGALRAGCEWEESLEASKSET